MRGGGIFASMTAIRALFAVALLWDTALLFGATFTVTSNGETGPGTLKQAILDANAIPGRDEIRFTVPQATIEPAGLPPITDAVDINGLLGDGSHALVEMPAPLDVTGGFKFHPGSNTSTIRNVVTGAIPNAALEIDADTFGITVANNRFGGNVNVFGSDNVFEANSFSAASLRVFISGLNNLLGLNTVPLIALDTAAISNEIGRFEYGNSIGRLTSTSSNLTVAFNTFTGSAANPAIDITGSVFPEGTIFRNTISGYATGIRITGAAGYRIEGNSIFSTGIPIDLGADGPSPNDPSPDADTGANNLQNYPVLTSATLAGGVLTVTGTLTSAPLTSYTVELFADTAADPEARTFLGSFVVMTGATGEGAFNQSTSLLATADQVITSTAIRHTGGDTSEVSAPVAVDAPGTLALSATTYTVNESTGTIAITVNRTDGRDRTVTAQYSTHDSDAIAPEDYTTTSGTLTFGPGVTSQTFNIPIVADGVPESEERFLVLLSNPTGGAVVFGSDDTATVLIASHLPGHAIPTASTWALLVLAAALAVVTFNRIAT
jgi:Calx-beta domain